MNITEALTAVRDGALQGKKLEAWCEEHYVKWSYNLSRHRFVFCGDHDDAWYPIEEDKCEFTQIEILGTWHVREVEEVK